MLVAARNKQDRSQFLTGSRSAFTVVELMVVIGIIITVLALLSTALNQTRSRTYRITCLDNMKQLNLAWRMYAEDNNDLVALNKSVNPGAGAQLVSMANSSNSWVAGNPREDRTTAGILRGTLYPYLKTVEVYKCPQDESKLRNGTPRSRSYSVSTYWAGDDEGADSRVKSRLSDLISPSPDRVFVFAEEHQDSIWSASFVVLPRERFSPLGGAWYSLPADRHEQGCNISFADGHLETWKWLAPKRPATGIQLINNPKDLKDLRKMQAALPY
jgi:prepilin-type processing-associated H-X9-DG protein